MEPARGWRETASESFHFEHGAGAVTAPVAGRKAREPGCLTLRGLSTTGVTPRI
jgi:hypothetical protein